MGCLPDLVWEMDAPGYGLLTLFNTTMLEYRILFSDRHFLTMRRLLEIFV